MSAAYANFNATTKATEIITVRTIPGLGPVTSVVFTRYNVDAKISERIHIHWTRAFEYWQFTHYSVAAVVFADSKGESFASWKQMGDMWHVCVDGWNPVLTARVSPVTVAEALSAAVAEVS